MDRDRYEEDKNNTTYTEVYVWGGNLFDNFLIFQAITTVSSAWAKNT
jgi:hypothetical protein